MYEKNQGPFPAAVQCAYGAHHQRYMWIVLWMSETKTTACVPVQYCVIPFERCDTLTTQGLNSASIRQARTVRQEGYHRACLHHGCTCHLLSGLVSVRFGEGREKRLFQPRETPWRCNGTEAMAGNAHHFPNSRSHVKPQWGGPEERGHLEKARASAEKRGEFLLGGPS
jgi:hypothetical protein